MEKTLDERIAFVKSKTTQDLVSLALDYLQQAESLENSPTAETESTQEQIEDWYSQYYDIMYELHSRGTDAELDICLKFAKSPVAFERIVSADILGQLAYQDYEKYYDIAVIMLIQLLDDSDKGVLESAGIALGHRLKRDDFRAIDKLTQLAKHPNFLVRNGVVSALSGFEHPQAIQTMMTLCKDESDLVRDWATFSLGSQIELDTPEIRAVLHQQLDDKDSDVRGEAFIGLAERGDRSMLEKLKNELAGEFEGSYAIRASGLLGEPSLLPYLLELEKTAQDEMTSYHKGELADAIQACTKN